MTVQDFKSIILIILVSITITILLPGIVSFLNGTFYLESMIKKIPLEQQNEYKSFSQTHFFIEGQISTIDKRLSSSIDSSNSLTNDKIEIYLKLREKLKKDIESKSPITIIPFYLNPQMLLWLGVYSSYLILIYLIAQRRRLTLNFKLRKAHFTLALLIYIFYEWPLWVRNFLLTSKGRTVYAYPNIDIDKASFFTQELIVFLFCYLSSILIFLCLNKYKNAINSTSKKNITVNDFLVVSGYYSSSYKDWFVNSVILASGFLSFTSFFWRLVFVYGDQRYMISALNAHIIWALCWVAISLNLFYYMQQFDSMKREILRNSPDDKTLRIVMEHQPAGNITIITSGLVSLITFLSPILKMIFQK